jgi:hypothetical protein
MIKAPRPQGVELFEWQIAERERRLRDLRASPRGVIAEPAAHTRLVICRTALHYNFDTWSAEALPEPHTNSEMHRFAAVQI